MRATVMRGGNLVVDTVDEPVPGPGEVLVKTLACGICGSDLHALTPCRRAGRGGARLGSALLDGSADATWSWATSSAPR